MKPSLYLILDNVKSMMVAAIPHVSISNSLLFKEKLMVDFSVFEIKMFPQCRSRCSNSKLHSATAKAHAIYKIN